MSDRRVHGLLALIAALMALHLMLPCRMTDRSPANGSVHAVLRARQIELVSADGTVVGQLHISDDGSGNLRLRNGNGEVRVQLGVSPDGSGLVLLDRHAEPAIQLHAKPDGPRITLNEHGQSRRAGWDCPAAMNPRPGDSSRPMLAGRHMPSAGELGR